jgi:hypothetical protein
VIWPGGATQRLEHINVDQMTVVTEPR